MRRKFDQPIDGVVSPSYHDDPEDYSMRIRHRNENPRVWIIFINFK